MLRPMDRLVGGQYRQQRIAADHHCYRTRCRRDISRARLVGEDAHLARGHPRFDLPQLVARSAGDHQPPLQAPTYLGLAHR